MHVIYALGYLLQTSLSELGGSISRQVSDHGFHGKHDLQTDFVQACKLTWCPDSRLPIDPLLSMLL